VRRQIERSARTTNGTFKVNQTAVEGINLVIPPLAKQARFGELVEVTKRMGGRLADPLNDDLLGSLVQHAFRGELTWSRSKRPFGVDGGGSRELSAT
jgi:type I restriction enzyme S subunit